MLMYIDMRLICRGRRRCNWSLF